MARNSLRKNRMSKSVPSRLDENIEDDAVLVDRSPEIVGDSVDVKRKGTTYYRIEAIRD